MRIMSVSKFEMLKMQQWPIVWCANIVCIFVFTDQLQQSTARDFFRLMTTNGVASRQKRKRSQADFSRVRNIPVIKITNNCSHC
jgi:hypothetical protein